ncbi:nucleotide disphospho-sugar-binding domain-containing protein [Streptomyces sp. NPDC006235]|uniref:glycosyltransferase n=1 Tax=Streptomyces sp. NPDC006235 TaxID=3156736 RepID=UPI0033ABB1C6
MRFLFVTGGSPATVFAFAPLAGAVRGAGHEVLVATLEENLPYVEGLGLPPLSMARTSELEILSTDGSERPDEMLKDPAQQMRLVGRWYARLSRGSLPTLREVAAGWRPDVVVGGRLAYAAQLLALELGVPYVRHPWGLGEWQGYDVGGEEELRAELDALGLDGLPRPDLVLDFCPPLLLRGRTGGGEGGELMRWIPANLQRRVEPWMYTRGAGRRICVTTGTRVTDEKTFDALGRGSDFLRQLVKTAGTLDAELVVAAPEEIAAPIRAELPDVRAGWTPLDVVAPTCDLIVSHGGTNTSMVALNAGVPQLNIAKMHISVLQSRLISDYGAGVTIPAAQATQEDIIAACERLLTDPAPRARAAEVSADIAALPAPAALVPRMTALAAG